MRLLARGPGRLHIPARDENALRRIAFFPSPASGPLAGWGGREEIVDAGGSS